MDKSVFTKHYAALTKRLKELRKASGLSQQDLADRLKRPQTMVARIEQGQRRVDIVEIYWICKALNVDPIQLATEILKLCQELDKEREHHRQKRR